MNEDERKKLVAHYEEKNKEQRKKATTAQYILAASISTLLLSADAARTNLSPNKLFAFIEIVGSWAVLACLAGVFIDGVEHFVDSFCFSYYGERNKFNTVVLSAVACLVANFIGSFLR